MGDLSAEATQTDFLDAAVQTEVACAKRSLSSPSKHTLLENLTQRCLKNKPRKRKHPGDEGFSPPFALLSHLDVKESCDWNRSVVPALAER